MRSIEQMNAAKAVLQDLEDGDEALSLKDSRARALLARTEKRRLDISVIYRYRTSGARAIDGSRVILETAILPGRIVTSARAISRFLSRLNGIDGIVNSRVTVDHAERAAERRLAAAGL